MGSTCLYFLQDNKTDETNLKRGDISVADLIFSQIQSITDLNESKGQSLRTEQSAEYNLNN